ncbi:MAG: hypothetical protein SNH73_03165 [Rikenellaceae bacterium]
MDITQIENTISALALAQGYSPLIASEQGLEKSITTFPTAWISLPKVLYVEGRDQGVICHKISLTLLEDYNAYSFEDKTIRLNEMQNDAIEIMTLLSKEEGVVEVSAMTITPRVVATTRHGDIAQLCEASVVTYF